MSASVINSPQSPDPGGCCLLLISLMTRQPKARQRGCGRGNAFARPSRHGFKLATVYSVYTLCCSFTVPALKGNENKLFEETVYLE